MRESEMVLNLLRVHVGFDLHGKEFRHSIFVRVVFILEVIVIEVMVVFVNTLIVATLTSFFVENFLDFRTSTEIQFIRLGKFVF